MKPVVFRAVVSGSVALVTGLFLLSHSYIHGSGNQTSALTQRVALAKQPTTLGYVVLYCLPEPTSTITPKSQAALADLPLSLSQHPLSSPSDCPESVTAELSRRFSPARWQVEQTGKLSLDQVGTFQTGGTLAGKSVVEATEYRPVQAGEAVRLDHCQVSRVEYDVSGQTTADGWSIAARINRHVLIDNRYGSGARPADAQTHIVSPLWQADEMSAGGGAGNVAVKGTSGWRFVCASGPGSLDAAVWPGQHVIFVYVK